MSVFCSKTEFEIITTKKTTTSPSAKRPTTMCIPSAVTSNTPSDPATHHGGLEFRPVNQCQGCSIGGLHWTTPKDRTKRRVDAGWEGECGVGVGRQARCWQLWYKCIQMSEHSVSEKFFLSFLSPSRAAAALKFLTSTSVMYSLSRFFFPIFARE